MEVVKKYHKDVIGVLLLCLLVGSFLTGCTLSEGEVVDGMNAAMNQAIEDHKIIEPESTNEILPIDYLDTVVEVEVLEPMVVTPLDTID